MAVNIATTSAVHASKKVRHDCPVRTVPAGEVERAVMEQLRSIFRSPELVARTYAAARQLETDETERLTARKSELEEKDRAVPRAGAANHQRRHARSAKDVARAAAGSC